MNYQNKPIINEKFSKELKIRLKNPIKFKMYNSLLELEKLF